MSAPTELGASRPLNPRVYAVLLALVEGPEHGYRILSLATERAAGGVSLDPGSLYRIIARLVRDGLIAEARAPRDAEREDARRRYYRLTHRGLEVSRRETQRLRELLVAPAARRLLSGRGAGR